MTSSAVSAAPTTAPTPQQRERNRVRFETELEFVSCLANPWYLQSLAQQNLLTSEPFLNYLNYLLYFTSPRYSRFLTYPQSLHYLRLLTAPGEKGEAFRRMLKEDGVGVQVLAGKMVGHWAGWREREGGVGASAGEGKVAEEGKNEEKVEA
ncbi:hypothetical protein JCM11641_003220 [Rhodosporidiobolus odoratus]